MQTRKQHRAVARCIILCTILLLILSICLSANAVYEPIERQEQAHQIAELARAMGLPEHDPIIVRAKELWQEADVKCQLDADLMAKTMYGEGRGLSSKVELACVGWCVLNRVDAGYGSINAVVTAPHQFAYSSTYPTVTDTGIDLIALSRDVLKRWHCEQSGEINVGRVLPTDYLWYTGDGKHNNFRNSYKGRTYWDYSLPNPYDG